ncbi:MAG: TlpA family protein disulfide reductase, partial [Pseudomonadales bacterium]|nr:TlpA family protein disulfide reductase [Pseudomonadales bacterium]
AKCLEELGHQVIRLQERDTNIEEIERNIKGCDFLLFAKFRINNNPKEVEEFLHDMKITYPILYDLEQRVSQQYAVKEMPSSFIIDRDGNIRHEHVGYQPSFAKLYEQEIQRLVGQ